MSDDATYKERIARLTRKMDHTPPGRERDLLALTVEHARGYYLAAVKTASPEEKAYWLGELAHLLQHNYK